MELSEDSSLKRMVADAIEDYELLDIRDLTEPLKFFHKVIRTKYFMRIQRKFDTDFRSRFAKYQGFEVLQGLEDHYEFYSTYYWERRAFHQLVDCRLFGSLSGKIKTALQAKDSGAKDSKKQPGSLQSDLESALQDFKLQVEILVDFYDRANLYNLLDVEMVRKFYKFDVKCTTLSDIIVPFFLSKLFGGLNKASSAVLNRFLLFILTNVLKVNFFATSLIAPEFDFIFSTDNRIGKSIERLIFSRLFRNQRNKIMFMFTQLNAMIAEHIAELDGILQVFFADQQPLDYDSFATYYEILNAKYDEINRIKFPETSGAVLDINDICKITDFKLKRESLALKHEQNAQFYDDYDVFGEDIHELRDEEYWQRMIELESRPKPKEPACFIKPPDKIDTAVWRSNFDENFDPNDIGEEFGKGEEIEEEMFDEEMAVRIIGLPAYELDLQQDCLLVCDHQSNVRRLKGLEKFDSAAPLVELD
jgi:hypothetical protein